MEDIKRDPLNNPKLKENPFVAPNGYLETLEERVMERIAPKKKPAQSFVALLRPAMGFVAAFALLFSIGYCFMYLSKSLTGERLPDTLQIVENRNSDAEETLYEDYEDALEQYLIECGISASDLTAEAGE